MLAEQAEEYMPELEYDSLAKQVQMNGQIAWKSNSAEKVMDTYVDINIGADSVRKSVIIRVGIERSKILEWIKNMNG